VPRVRATPDQFKFENRRITHIPTGAWFAPYPGQVDAGNWNQGKLGDVQSNGDDYDVDQVKKMIRTILLEHGP
jgi:hypothetical protein